MHRYSPVKINSNKKLGISLIEFIIYTAVLIVVIGSATGFAVFQMRTHRAEQKDINLIDNGRVMLEQIVRDLKRADSSTISVAVADLNNRCAIETNIFSKGTAATNLLFPCIQFKTIPEGEGEGETETIEYRYAYNLKQPQCVYKKVGTGSEYPISDAQVDFLGFSVYYLKSNQAQKPRITVILRLKSDSGATYSFQNTVFPDSSYEVVPETAL